MAITLNQFIENTSGTTVSNPDGTYPGQCVSLVQQYLYQCLDLAYRKRGDAKEWINTLIAEGIAERVSTPQAGDIVVCPNKGVVNGVVYGHIGIVISNNMMFEQNYGLSDDPLRQTARSARTFSQFVNGDNEYAIFRPFGVGTTLNLTGIYLIAQSGKFNIRDLAGTGNILTTVSVGEEAQILGFRPGFITTSNGESYQWAFVKYGSIKGYAQLDLKNDYLIRKTVGSSKIYLKAVNEKFYIRTAVVSGSSMALVPIGNRAEILNVGTGFESDNYQWAQTSYNGCTGWSQMDTVGSYQLERE